ncbi:MAG: DUF3105 domain-containing protein [Rubrobacteraceae bacterium]|nr:DUF3105 domain-containing protein [Rubrobacteraceae bacterium]
MHAVLFGLIVAAAIGTFVPLALMSDRGKASSELPGVKSFEDLSFKHNEGSIVYEQNPPVGGEHNPVWQNAGFYEKPVLEERAVHTLEHGAVWITYSVDLPQDQIEELRRIVESQDCLLASPYPSLPAPVVASAWGRQLRLDSVDDPDLQEFIRTYRKGPQTLEPGAPCTGATEMSPPPKDDGQ